MKIIVRVLALLFATLDACALADDAVGVMRVDVACTLQATQPSESASGVHGCPWGQTPWKPVNSSILGQLGASGEKIMGKVKQTRSCGNVS
jgi:hypothetical protein